MIRKLLALIARKPAPTTGRETYTSHYELLDSEVEEIREMKRTLYPCPDRVWEQY